MSNVRELIVLAQAFRSSRFDDTGERVSSGLALKWSGMVSKSQANKRKKSIPASDFDNITEWLGSFADDGPQATTPPSHKS